MNCEDIRELLSLYDDDRLDDLQSQRIAAHLVECSGCRAELEALRYTSHLVGAFTAPPLRKDLALNVLACASQPRWREWWIGLPKLAFPMQEFVFHQLGRAAAVVALFVLATLGSGKNSSALVAALPDRAVGYAATGVAEFSTGLAKAQTVFTNTLNESFEVQPMQLIKKLRASQQTKQTQDRR